MSSFCSSGSASVVQCRLFVLLLVVLTAPSALLAQRSHTPIPDSVIIIAKMYDAANNAHDTAQLRKLYSYEVGCYNKTITRKAAINLKADFFKAHPTYHQSCSNYTIDTMNSGFTLNFDKQVDEDGKRTFYRGYITIDTVEDVLLGDPQQWRVILESDSTVDSVQLEKLTTIDPTTFKSCDDVENAIVRSAVSKIMTLDPALYFDRDPNDSADNHLYHVYFQPPMSGVTRTMGWYTFITKTCDLIDDINNEHASPTERPILMDYDRALLPYLKKFCK